MSETVYYYDQALQRCQQLFVQKNTDYGTAWRILRPSSLTDQLYIKAQRIRNIELAGTSAVAEGIEPEFIGIVNYAFMALIQLQYPVSEEVQLFLSAQEVLSLYEAVAAQTRQLMIQKNTDYGDAWRWMRVSSYTDLILMKLLRTKQIENNSGQTLVSEGVDANYQDIANYALFALIQLYFIDQNHS
ncbi:MAG: DUF1599 domain-containing protein [Chitinophagales bacterium]|jgi:hypothetical protein|nr:DUF1599 domain-containing protein [Chitinophagales bacterium]HNI44054.1 DUF1599 domain-containing protein [Chitinophagales bacterium]HNL07191.1 DUF1599 domain-containing protein [Chitinophagales bacterium]